MNTLPKGTVLRGERYEYRIQSVLGQGGMGITYLAVAHDARGKDSMEFYVALKEFFLKDNCMRNEATLMVTGASQGELFDKYKRKFIGEVQHLRTLYPHKHIIRVIEGFEANNTAYYSMEYIDGGSLLSYINKDGCLSEEETVALGSQIADVLDYMHKKRKLHLDVKPENVMRRSDGTLVLIDFGLAKQFKENGEAESSTTIGGGTPGYAPIEQADYHASQEQGFPVTLDIYAFGATLLKMLTGMKLPTASEVLSGGFPRKALEQKKVSKPLVDLIEHCMNPKPARRPQSMQQVKAKLSSLVEHKTNNWVRYAMTAMVLVIGVIIGVMLSKGCDDSRQEQEEVVDTTQSYSGYIAGHEYVDLGLRVKWATCNVGASSPEDTGYYFAWGETEPKSEYTEANSKTYGDASIGNIAGNPQYDAARANWGGSWRLPTKAEMQELLDSCTQKWTTQNGVEGRLFTSKKNGKSIFLPAAGSRYGSSLSFAGESGYFWSASPYESYSYYAYYLYFGSGNAYWLWSNRHDGHSVRPVSE